MRPRKDLPKPSTPEEQVQLLQSGKVNSATPLSASVDVCHDANLSAKSSPGHKDWCRFLSANLKSCTHIFVAEPLFTLIIPTVVLDTYVLYAWMLFLVPHAEWMGIERSRAVFLSSIAGLSGIFGRIAYLLLLHFHVDSILIFTVSSAVLGLSLFTSSVSSTYAYQAMMSLVQGFTIFIIDSIPHALLKLAIENDDNLPSGIAAAVFFVGVGAAIGNIISG